MFPGFTDKKVLYVNDRHEEKDTGREGREKLYDKRILSLLGTNDLAIFGGKIDSFLWKYYRDLRVATIDKRNVFYEENFTEYASLTKAVIDNPLILETIKKRSPDAVISYIASRDTKNLAEKINSRILEDFRKVDYFSNKANYRKVVRKLGFPVIAGFRVNSLKDAQKYFSCLKAKGFRKAVIKEERSAGGFGVFVVGTEKELESQVKKIVAKKRFFLIEGFIENVIASPNIQYWITAKKVKFITLSDQLFGKNGVSQKGNIFPSSLNRMPVILKKVKDSSLKICCYLQSQNCCGLAGIDYLITKEKDIYATEVNFRINYSTFPALIAQKLYGSGHSLFWKTFTVKGRPLLFKKLFNSARDIFITRKKNFGIFPLDIGILKSKGEGEFMAVAPTLRGIENYERRLIYIYENLS